MGKVPIIILLCIRNGKNQLAQITQTGYLSITPYRQMNYAQITLVDGSFKPCHLFTKSVSLTG